MNVSDDPMPRRAAGHPAGRTLRARLTASAAVGLIVAVLWSAAEPTFRRYGDSASLLVYLHEMARWHAWGRTVILFALVPVATGIGWSVQTIRHPRWIAVWPPPDPHTR